MVLGVNDMSFRSAAVRPAVSMSVAERAVNDVRKGKQRYADGQAFGGGGECVRSWAF